MGTLLKAVPLVVFCALIIAVPSVSANWVPDGVAICTAAGIQQAPALVSDGAGGAIVTWMDHRGGTHDIYAQSVDASGAVQWAAGGVALCAATGDQDFPMIVSDGAGGAVITWYDQRSGTNYDIYAQRVNASGAVQWTTDGVALCTATRDQVNPTMTSDGAGGTIVAWYDYRSGSNDIYAQRVDASGAVQWTTDGVALATGAGDQGSPTIAPDGAGGAIVTWFDSRNGSKDIYAQRVDASGALQWTANGVALCTAVGDQMWPAMISDGAGGAIVTWMDSRSNGVWHIYAQRVNGSGAVQWTPDGVRLCANSYQESPQITSDGAGGAIVTWFDSRSGSNWDIYAGCVNASGGVQWTADGVAICAAAGVHRSLQITPDGGGGAIVTWQDDTSGNNDIYAQRVNGSGAVQWTIDGVALCMAMGAQDSPQITSDGAGGAIVTWHDIRNPYPESGDDIYAQRVDANGFAVLTGTETPAVPIELHQNYPNPFNPVTTVTYSIPEKCNVALKIYDVSGKCIACVVDGQQEKGSYAVEWNGKDEEGNSVASGIYFYELTAGNQMISKKMVLLR